MTILATVGTKNKLQICLICNECKRSFLKKNSVKTALSKSIHFCSRQCVILNKDVQTKKGSSRSISLSEIKKRLYERHGDLITIVDESYKSISKKATFIDVKYGSWSAQVKSVLQGRRHTKHKMINFVKSRQMTHDNFRQKLITVHQNKLSIKSGELYTNSHKKITLIDKDYGEWNVMPYSVLCGVQHPNRAKKQRDQKSKFSYNKLHWKTKESLICVGSYELAFVNWCNKNKYDFVWQIPFSTPEGKLYYVDAQLLTGPLANMYIEIKGTWMRKNGHIGKQKWEWFHSEHKNSLLLMKKELQLFGIL